MRESVRISPKLASALVFLSGHETPPKVQLAALAEALHASVEQDRSGLLLDRRAEDSKRFEEGRVLERAAWIQKRIDGVARYRASLTGGELDASAVVGEVENAYQGSLDRASGRSAPSQPFFATELLPSEGVLVSLVGSIGKDVLASLPTGTSQVWEDAPVSGAAQLPPYSEALAKYEREIAAFRASTISSSLSSELDWLHMGKFFTDWESDSPPPVRMRLQVRAQDTEVLLLLCGFDTGGNQRFMASMIARPVAPWRPAAAVADEARARGNGRAVELSESATEAAGMSLEKLVAKPPRWFSAPEQEDPLNAFVAEALGSLAGEEPDRCFAAQVSDTMWDDARICFCKGHFSPDAFKAVLLECSRYEREESPDRIVWRSKERLETSACVANRQALGNLARSVLSSKRVDLRTLAAYHLALGGQPTCVATYWENALRLAPGVFSFSGDATHAFYSLLGAISDVNWLQLESGAIRSNGQLGVVDQFADLLDEDQMPVQANRQLPDVLRHPRELYPRGDIEGAPVTLSRIRHLMVGFQGPKGDGAMQWSEGAPVFPMITVADRPDTGRTLSMTRPQFEHRLAEMHFQFGTQDEIVATIGLPSGAFERAGFKDAILATSAVLPFEELPQRTKDEIWQKACDSASNYHVVPPE
jgi:hypothetical protein